MSTSYLRKAKRFPADDGTLRVTEFLEALNGEEWFALLNDLSHEGRDIVTLLQIASTDDPVGVLGAFFRELPSCARELAGRGLARVLASLVRSRSDDVHLERALFICGLLRVVPNEPLLQRLAADPNLAPTMRTQAAYLLASPAAEITPPSFWRKCDLRRDQCLIGPAMLGLSKVQPDDALRLLAKATPHTMPSLELPVRDVVASLLRGPHGYSEFLSITPTMPPAALEFLAELDLIDRAVPDELAQTDAPMVRAESRIQVTNHMIGTIERQVIEYARERKWKFTDVVVMADRIDPPNNALREAVTENLRNGVRYRFFVPASRRRNALYVRDFMTIAQDVIGGNVSRRLVKVKRLPTRWGNVPYLFYRFENAEGHEFIAGFRGNDRFVGISQTYSPLNPMDAQALFSLLRNHFPPRRKTDETSFSDGEHIVRALLPSPTLVN